MAEGVLMPKAGITVEECVITEWLKKEGDQVAIGDVLFTYETDKASFECESTAAGTLLKIFYHDGDEVPVLVNVCAVGAPGDDISVLSDASSGADEPVEETHAEIAAKPAAPAQTSAANPDAKVSPRAKIAAGTLGVEATSAVPTGPHGRIIERDVRTLAESGHLSPDSVSAMPEEVRVSHTEAGPGESPEYVDIKFSSLRKAAAKSMTSSLSTMAQLTLNSGFDATGILALRKEIKANAEKLGLPSITPNDMIMYAVSRVLHDHTDLNAAIPEDNVLRKFANVHLGMAVDTPRGLMVPTIRFADLLTLAELSREAKRLARICQEGKATLEMLEGATFTVTNLGVFGIESFTPVINPPQVAILGVCGVSTAVRETDGVIKTYPRMGLSLTFDHRAVDGAPAARFLKDLTEALENFTLLTFR